MRRLKIVLVEDDYRLLEGLKRDLEQLEMEVVGAYENLLEFNAKTPGLDFDLAIIDLQLDNDDSRNRDGWKAINTLTKTRAFPIIIHTSHGRDEAWKRLERHPTISFIKKMTNRSELMTAIGNTLVRVHGHQVLEALHLPHIDKNCQELNELSPNHFSLLDSSTRKTIIYQVAEIKVIKSSERGMLVCHLSGEHNYAKSLTDFQKSYQHPDLMRINQKYIINRRYIKYVYGDHAYIIQNGVEKGYSISKKYKPVVKAYLNEIRSR